MAATNTPPETPWHAAFEPPISKPTFVSREEVRQWFLPPNELPTTDTVLVDLRKNDHVGGTIMHSINLPAQSVYFSIVSLFHIFQAAKVKRVVWYCGSSSGRAPRAAAWFSDYLKERDDREMKSLVLEGGIKGWAKSGKLYTILMDGYDAAAWEQ